MVVLCPRCGSRGWVEEKEISGRTYIYVAHEERGPDGRRRRRYCYLGPRDSYEYVSKLHEREGLVLKGLLEKGRALDYLERLIGYIEAVVEAEEGEESIDIERLRAIAQRLEDTARKLRAMAEKRAQIKLTG